MTTKQPPKVEVNRSSISGRFVTETYAQKHPRTTETEHYRRQPPPAPTGGGKGK